MRSVMPEVNTPASKDRRAGVCIVAIRQPIAAPGGFL
jgi:hypothetical protein